ncbi:YibE/F family protein [Candidatus Parcubacteria bacterium]|nr:MAG: YibE/F family protein [Candidatus Parcubacteria bacterium]
MRFLISAVGALILLVAAPSGISAQELVQDTVTTSKARVLEVLSQESRFIPGTDTPSIYQTIRVEILDGEEAGEVIVVENDYLALKEGEVFYLRHTVDNIYGTDYYTVSEPYRLPVLATLAALFIGITLYFGGRQGARGLLALMMSFLFIVLFLLPGILQGYSPILVSIGVSSLIILIGSYVTHGFNKMTTTAVLGMITTIVMTGILAHVAIGLARLSGFSTDESVYLNFNTSGAIDITGLLLGSILIGILGVLYDAAIGQAVAVEELTAAGPELSRKTIYTRAFRMGREHIGALVNTLAIAYVGVSLPLLLLFYGFGSDSILITLNREIFATEIIRTLVGSIGIILTVPITTAVAVRMLVKSGHSGATIAS